MPNEPRYRLRALIARGGMAEVWRADDLDHEPPAVVAIKRILDAFASDPTLARLFEDEAAVLARFDHPCIPRLLGAGVLEGRPFHALELIDGPDAGSVLQEGTFPFELALYVAERVASALAYVHGLEDPERGPLGIVHRDVSPSNVLCARNGRVVITDFGIALGKDRRERTATGMTKGKAAYMSPEQTLGGRVDGRTDVFALGCTLHALVSGRSPLADPDAMAGLLAGEKVPISAELPADLRAIIERAIAPRAAARYPTMGAMHEALSSALAARGLADPASALAAFLAPLSGAPQTLSERDSAPPTLSAKAASGARASSGTPGRERFLRAVLAIGAACALGVALTSMDLGGPEPRAGTGEARVAADVVMADVGASRGAAPLDDRARPVSENAAPEIAPAPTEVVARGVETPPRASHVAAPREAAAEADPEADTETGPEAEGAAGGETGPAPIEIVPVPVTAPNWGVVNFRLPREARVSLDGGRTPFRDVTRGHPCDTTGLCHLPVGRHALVVTLADGTRETASLCVSEGSTTRVISPLAGDPGCD